MSDAGPVLPVLRPGTRSRSMVLAADVAPPMQVAAATFAAAAASQSVGTLPAQVDLVLYRGDDFYLDITVTDTGGGAVDLTGYTATAQVRLSTESSEILATFVGTTAANVVHLHLDDPEASKLTADAVWDVQVAGPSGDVTTLAFGAVHATPDVTRP